MLRLTRAQVREVDRLSIEKYHVPGVVLMENAAMAVVKVVLAKLPRDRRGRVAILCGGGNNGGDGLAVARHLSNALIDVRIVLCTDPERYRGDASINYRIVEAMRLPTAPRERAHDVLHAFGPDVIVDAVFGTGLEQPPRDSLDDLVTLVDVLRSGSRRAGVIAVDLPSGLDCDAGIPLGKAIKASKTVTFVAEKAGFANPASKEYTGEVIVGDIGCPRGVIEEVLRPSR